MNKADRSFFIILAFSSLLLIGIVAENIRSAQTSLVFKKTVDVAKVKADITAAGLTPTEAKYWKVLNGK